MKNDVKFVNGLPVTYMAASYGCGTYGSGTFSNGEACTTTGSDGGTLPDTGYNILLPLALGVALIIAAGILIVKRIRRRRK